jgi:hypothetical protein
MNVFALVWPGTWLDEPHMTAEDRSAVESLLRVLDDHLKDAALALIGFERPPDWSRETAKYPADDEVPVDEVAGGCDPGTWCI